MEKKSLAEGVATAQALQRMNGTSETFLRVGRRWGRRH
jgi:hypothetical protein